MTIAAIILAAGASTRMGQSKQLLPVNDRPLLLRTIDTVARAGLIPTVVVLGANYQEHQELIRNSNINIPVIINHRWQSGMGSSLKAGLNHLLTHTPSLDAVIMLVCDQPEISTNLLKSLIHQYKHSKNPVIASAYARTAGVPALFYKTIFPELLQLDDSHGAQKIIHKDVERLSIVDFPEGAVDIDTPQDYENYIKTKKPSAG